MKVLKGKTLGNALAFMLLAVIVVGAILLSSRSPSAAARPQCGPTILRTCTFPNSTQKTVGGTVCDITRYQQQTVATCTPSGL